MISVRTLVLAVLLAVSMQAQAGFISGMIVGSAMSSGGSSTSGGSILVASDQHDVIACDVPMNDPGRCRVPHTNTYPTPEEYAAKLGYKFIHRKAVVITPRNDHVIVMEVSK